MSNNKFNQYGSEGDANVIDGSLDIYGYTLRAENLNGGEPLKTNSIGQLISSKLNIADVNNLQAELDSSIQNPNQSILVTDGLDITTGNTLRADNITGLNTSIVNFTNINCSGNINTSGSATSDRCGTNILVNETGTGTLPIGIATDLNFDAFNNGTKKNISNVDNIETQTLNVNSTSTLGLVNANVLNASASATSDRCGTNILVNQTGTGTLPIGIATDLNFDAFNNGNKKNISNVATTTTTNIKVDVIASVLGGINDDILVNNDFAMNNAGISNAQRVAMAGNILMNNNDILNGGTINIDNVNSSNVDTTTLDAGNINVTNNTITSSSVLEFKSGASDRVNFKSDNGILSIENNNLGANVELEFAQFGSETFTIIKDNAKVNICQSGTNNIELTTDCFVTNKKVILNPSTSTTQFRDYDIDMNNNNIDNVDNMNINSINNLTPVGGIFTGISDGATITSSTFADLLPITSLGSLSVPANTFLLGSAFHLVCAGIFPDEDAKDNVEIELCAIQGATTIQLGLVNLDLENFDTEPSNFELEADFVIRGIGTSAEVAVSFDFTFNKKVTKDFKGTRATNLATIDTTQASTLALNARIIGAS